MNGCNICNNLDFTTLQKKVRDSNFHKVVLCKKCGLVQIYPTPTLNEEKKFYDENRQFKNQKSNLTLKDIKIKTFYDTKRRVKLISYYTPTKGKILEIGSGYGFVLEFLNRLGYDVKGIEISKERRKISKRITSAPILNFNLLLSKPKIGKFDTLMMFQVLEHISNPVDFLKNTKKLLKNKGKIVIEVPNLNDFQLKQNNSYNKWYWQRAHLNYFSPQTLKLVMLKAGFKRTVIKGIQRYSIENMFYWKLKNKPQLKNPTHILPKKYHWLENFYKKNLEQKFVCDTIIAIGTNFD